MLKFNSLSVVNVAQDPRAFQFGVSPTAGNVWRWEVVESKWYMDAAVSCPSIQQREHTEVTRLACLIWEKKKKKR